MGKHRFLWAFSFAMAPSLALAVDPPNYTPPQTYIPPSAQTSPTVQQRMGTTQAQPPPGGPTRVDIPTPDTIPAPSTVTPAPGTTSAGQFRNAKGEVKFAPMLLNRYKQSVVRVSALDLAGNELARAMGVGVGRNAQYIATPLSLILGNGQQWADRIQVTHSEGNKYNARVALIDEERNIVLLAPEAKPAPMPFVRENNERPQMEVFAISFTDAPDGKITPRIVRGSLAAANPENGLLSVSGPDFTDAQAGTGLINTQGELMGMLLPGGQGVLASYIERLINKAVKAEPVDPQLIGVILGRGVLVGTGVPGAYPSIGKALEAIKKGEAPKTDPTRFFPAKTRTVAPKDAERVVVRVLPGRYVEPQTLTLPPHLSLAGSGPGQTMIEGANPARPVILIQKGENTMVSGFRVVPAAKQSMKAPAVIVSGSKNITLLGNVFESRGGVAVWALNSTALRLQGNAFPRGSQRAFSCERSQVRIEANAFLGDWPIALYLDRGCSADVQRSLFFENKTSAQIMATATRANFERNTFVRGDQSIRMAAGFNGLKLDDNLFYETATALQATGQVNARALGRNAVWRSRFVSRGRVITGMDLVRTEPQFQAPETYDFRLSEGQAQLAGAVRTPGADLGAFQRSDWVGPFTQQLARALAVATGEPDLAASWGIAGP